MSELMDWLRYYYRGPVPEGGFRVASGNVIDGFDSRKDQVDFLCRLTSSGFVTDDGGGSDTIEVAVGSIGISYSENIREARNEVTSK